MVINCVPLPEKRGEMLARLKAHLTPSGLLFLVLPTRCITSRQVGGADAFKALLELLGFQEVQHNALEKKVTPKLTFYVLQNSNSKVGLPDQRMDWRILLQNLYSKLILKKFYHFISTSESISASDQSASVGGNGFSVRISPPNCTNSM